MKQTKHIPQSRSSLPSGQSERPSQRESSGTQTLSPQLNSLILQISQSFSSPPSMQSKILSHCLPGMQEPSKHLTFPSSHSEGLF